MMEKYNEKGYTLLLVLLVVTVIMIISTTFISTSLSNAKQEKVVDTNNMSVVAAEMGVDYYKTAMVNAFNKEKSNLLAEAKSKVDALDFKKLESEEIPSKLEEIRQELIISLKEYFDTEISSIPSPENHPISATVNFDKLVSSNVEPIVGGVKIDGIVTGHSENKKYMTDLNFDITFEVPEIKLSSFEDGSDDDSAEGVNEFDNLYPDPEPIGLPVCSGDLNNKECMGDNRTSLKNVDNSTIYFPNGFSKENGNQELNGNGSKLYVKTDFKVGGVNNMSGISLFIDGKFKAKSNANGMNNSLIKVNGSFTAKNMNSNNESTLSVNGPFNVEGMQGLTRAKICVNDSFTVQGNMKEIESSDIYVNGPFNIDGHLDGNHFNIYVNGSFNVDKEIDGNHYNINVYDPEGNIPNKHAGKINVLDSSFVFPEECGFDATDPSWSLDSLDWNGEHEINVKY